jgi:hypothetical protein
VRLFLLLTTLRPDDFQDDDELNAFLESCHDQAQSESETL